MITLLIIFVAAAAVFGDEHLKFDGYQVHRVTPKTLQSLRHLKCLEREDSSLNFWTPIQNVGHYVDVMVPPHKKTEFQRFLEMSEAESELFIPNVQELIDNERPPRNKKNAEFGWDDYHTLTEINLWLSRLAATNPDIVTLQSAGTSYEGRQIVGVHMTFAPGNENKTVFLEGNIHACEWISSAVVTYILNELITSTDPKIRQVAASHDWYIFPVVNPDGFVYTHSTNRLWRKNRVPHGDNGCIGVDPNRNWGYHFGEGGTSDDPCSEMYLGPSAFSEPETQTFSQFLLNIGRKFEAYFSFHSYHQGLLIPYGYTIDHLDNYNELFDVGVRAVDVLSKRYGTQYVVGNVPELLYVAAGGSPDWVKGTFGTRITYTYELRDTGKYGFLLPADQIVPTAEETLDSILAIFQEFEKRGHDD